MDPVILVVIGRILIGAAFAFSGVRMFSSLQPLTGVLAAKGIPYPAFVVAAGATFEVLFGGLAIIGIWFQAVALLLAAFIVAATVMMHDFWNLPPGPARVADENAVITNVILVGALIAIAGLAA